MKQASFFMGTMAALVLLVNEVDTATPATTDQLIAAAKKEGQLELLAPSTLGPHGAQALGAGLNKKYGVNVTAHYSPSNNMVADVAKLVTQSVAGAPPEWDLMVVTDALFAVFLTTPEGQTLWEQYGGQTSAFIPGTTAYKYVQGKKVLYMTPDQAEMIDRLSIEYGKILGFQ
jgi:hypothetical protein